MKKEIIVTLISLILIIFLFTNNCVTTKSSRVVEYEFLAKQVAVGILAVENKTKYGQRRLADSAADILVSELSRSGNFILIERDKIDEILTELELQISDLTDNSQSAEIGKILNCQYFLTGVISNFGVKTEGQDMIIVQKKIQSVVVEVDIRVIDVETAQIVYSAYGRGEASKTIDNVLGVGGTGGYDESLAVDGLRAALSEAVKRIIGYFKSL